MTINFELLMINASDLTWKIFSIYFFEDETLGMKNRSFNRGMYQKLRIRADISVVLGVDSVYTVNLVPVQFSWVDSDWFFFNSFWPFIADLSLHWLKYWLQLMLILLLIWFDI